MRQKRRKPQAETTVHKDMVRNQLVRQYAPGVGPRLLNALEHAKPLQREGDGHE